MKNYQVWIDFVGPNDSFEKFKRYLENTTDGAEIHYLVDRDILMSYDTDLNLDKKAGENLEFGEIMSLWICRWMNFL